MDNTKEILKDQFKKLPKDIQDAILAVDLRSKMQFITKKNNLHIDQTEALENEAVFVLLGLEHPSGLVTNIAKHVEVSEEKAEAIVEDLNREIFLKVRESLKKIFERKDEEGDSFLASSFLGNTAEKTDEEELTKEDILREIEDKEHHNLPSINKSELHLEIPFPREIVNLEMKHPSENQKMTDEIKREKPAEINLESDKIAKKPFESKEEALRTMEKDIFKAKMGGTVNVPKETVEIGDAVLSPKVKLPDVGKIDPYREKV